MVLVIVLLLFSDKFEELVKEDVVWIGLCVVLRMFSVVELGFKVWGFEIDFRDGIFLGILVGFFKLLFRGVFVVEEDFEFGEFGVLSFLLWLIILFGVVGMELLLFMVVKYVRVDW